MRQPPARPVFEPQPGTPERARLDARRRRIEILHLHRAGWTFDAIGQLYGVTRQRAHALASRAQDEERQALELDISGRDPRRAGDPIDAAVERSSRDRSL